MTRAPSGPNESSLPVLNFSSQDGFPACRDLLAPGSLPEFRAGARLGFGQRHVPGLLNIFLTLVWG